MNRLLENLIKVAQAGWAVTTRLVLVCVAVAAVLLALPGSGLHVFM